MARIHGPLGLWAYPILNFAIEVLTRFGRRPHSSGLRLSAENIERWELIRDSSGRLKGLVVHREVNEVE